MTKLLYLEDSYMTQFRAKIVEVIDKVYVVLDQTCFYPRGGGQLDDRGVMISERGEYEVLEVFKKDGKVLHKVDHGRLEVGYTVAAKIHWERRYMMMRMHTASHVVSAVFFNELGAKITGHQLDLDKSRTDFNLEEYDVEKIKGAIDKCNKYIEQDLPVRVFSLPREEAMKQENLFKLANVLPPSVTEIRVVEIEGLDQQADGGTHLKSLKECGRIVFLKSQNKGKSNRRVYFGLEEPDL